ncbi:MAG: TonB-dependent receptor domain-containing protein [Bryobacteraceae bacterium]
MTRIAVCALAVVMLARTVPAQDARGTIAGTVVDPQGAVIPAAEVRVVNDETNVAHPARTNATGFFEVGLLNPGSYSVAVEAAGFRKLLRRGLQLQVAGRIELKAVLELGAVADSIEVTADAPMLETSSASGGRVLTTREVADLPFSSNNPFTLAVLAPGVIWTGNPEARDLSAVEGTSKFNTMGGVAPNEYTIDGAPVTGTKGRVGFIPPSQAVSEFKLETTPFDASYGRTAGAIMNVSTKTGTNAFHGSLYDQHWQQRWNAMTHFTRLAYEDQVRRGLISPDTPKQNSGRSNNYGVTIGGPVVLPKVYHGKDKLFFFFNFNGIRLDSTDKNNLLHTVPRMSWRQGDFSDLLAVDAPRYTVYDPRSARSAGGRVLRTPFPGNKGVPVLNPMYAPYEKLFPIPNDPAGVVTPEGINNYIAARIPVNQRFKSFVNRYDYNISDRHRVFFRWYWNDHHYNAEDWTYETDPGLMASGKIRINKGGGGNYIWSIGASNLLDFGASYTRFSEGANVPARTKYRATDLGLPAYIDDRAGEFHQLTGLVFQSIRSLGAVYPGIPERGAVGEVKASMTSVRGNHSLRYGWQERRYWFTYNSPGFSSGRVTFNNSFMRAADNTTTASHHGLEWAAFRMGTPNQLLFPANDSAYWSTRNRALYVQDDWRLGSRFRLSFGLRYEREGGITERYNRGISGEFYRDMKMPYTDMVMAAYAANPLKELPASQFRVLGGTRYLGVNGPNTFTDGTHHFLPRLGAVYQLDSRTVLRGGYGWYYDTLNVNRQRASQAGYSQSTITPVSTDLGLTFCCGVGSAANLSSASNPLRDPWPVRPDGTRFEVPVGNALGGAILSGSGFTSYPRDYSPAWQQRWRVGVQRQLSRTMVLEVSYNGSFARIPLLQSLSYLPEQYWVDGNARNTAAENDLNQNVPNPFNIRNLAALQQSDPALYRWLSSMGLYTNTSVRKHTLLRAYPHLGGVSGVREGYSFADIRGRTTYHDAQVQFEKRFSHGLQSSVMYTNAHSEAQDYYFNEFDANPSWRPNDDVRRHRVVWSAIYQLPFGKGKPFLKQGIGRHLAGGWQVSWVYQYQEGPPLGFGNVFYYGDIKDLPKLLNHEEAHARDIHTWFDAGLIYTGPGAIPAGFTGFEGRSNMQIANFQKRVFPAGFDDIRADGLRLWDVKVMRNFEIRERVKTALSIDLLNAANHTNFGTPVTNPAAKNFGKVTSQNGAGRLIQLNLRIEF